MKRSDSVCSEAFLEANDMHMDHLSPVPEEVSSVNFHVPSTSGNCDPSLLLLRLLAS